MGYGQSGRVTAVGLAATAVAVGLGVFLRFYRLDWQSLWVDEISTLGPALHGTSLADGFWGYINLNPTPPLYYWFIQTWAAAFGFGEWTLRLPSALFGVATVAVVWFGLRRTFTREIVAITTVLMALSWPAIYYSQEVRTYSAVLFFVTWAAVSWVAILKDFERAPSGLWWQLSAAGLLATLSHPFGFIITGFQILYLFGLALLRRRHVVRVFLAGALQLAVYLAWIAANLSGLDWVLGAGIVFSRPGLSFLVDVGAFLFHHPVPALLIAVIPLSIGAWPYAKRLAAALTSRAWNDPAIALPFMLAVPFLFVFSVAQVVPFMYSRYLIVFLPFIYMFYAVVVTSPRWRSATTPVVLMSALTVLATYWIVRDYYVVDKEQVRELVHYVRTHATQNSAILTGCDPGPPFECALGTGARTDADWSKYLYYLNYDHLPELTVVPDAFNTVGEIDGLLARYRAAGKDTLIVFGSRAGTGYVGLAKDFLAQRSISCQVVEFHLALAATCPLR